MNSISDDHQYTGDSSPGSIRNHTEQSFRQNQRDIVSLTAAVYSTYRNKKNSLLWFYTCIFLNFNYPSQVSVPVRGTGSSRLQTAVGDSFSASMMNYSTVHVLLL